MILKHVMTVFVFAAGVSGLQAKAIPENLMAFVDQHCADCHDREMKKGGLDLYSLGFELGDREVFKKWQRVFERVDAGEMPPGEKRRPEKGDKEQFLNRLHGPLLVADKADVAAFGRVRGRRLTRTEYEHTLHDLLGIDVPLKNLLPEDGRSHGFETVASVQQLSHHQMARYLDVADRALDEAFKRALKGDETFKKRFAPKELIHIERGNDRSPELRNGRSISWPITLQFFGKLEATRAPQDGWYRITLHDVQAINPKNGVVWGTLRSGACVSSDPMLDMIGLVEATETERDLVYETWMEAGHMLELKPNDRSLKRPATGASGGNVSFKGRDLEKDGYSGIAHRGVSMERIYPMADHDEVRRNLFGANPDEAFQAPAGEVLPALIMNFARRAFRRPVEEDQLQPYLKIGRPVLEDGGKLPDALRASYRAILCSPRFLTFVESPGKLDDYAIASRLSYALWVSMPDPTLIRLADEGRLRDPKVLAGQVERMLADSKVQRFVVSYTDQWLNLREIDFTNPDSRRFPTFDPVLQESMLEETRSYVRHLIAEDLGVKHLVDSNFAFLNERLARHYFGSKSPEAQKLEEKKNGGEVGKKGEKPNPKLQKEPVTLPDIIPGKGLQKVALQSGGVRGGLITQGAVLKVTADGNSTSPVVRGVFVNERILGRYLPPPPPGVPAIEPDIRGASSIRDQLEKHRSTAACMTCHLTIDPPGFALECFDPVGVWRSGYRKGVAVDSSGVTPDGEAFADLLEWKRIYTEREAQLARGFAGQFVAYATGAAIRFGDQSEINAVVDRAKVSGYGIRSLIREVVLSGLFLEK
jgi:hypothetical protein